MALDNLLELGLIEYFVKDLINKWKMTDKGFKFTPYAYNDFIIF